MTESPQQTQPEPPLVADEILAYYARGEEDGRLRNGAGRLEFWRTQDILRRLFAETSAPDGARVLDVGGATGIHASWLAEDGHAVELIDPVPSHVEAAATLPGVTARVGDARDLDVDDAAFDVVLLLGPLYHLVERADRLTALTEARRVLRPGGLLVAATINRFAALHDTLRIGRYFNPGMSEQVAAVTASGVLRPSGPDSLFTTAYFHEPADVLTEITDAGLAPTGQYGVEGAAWLYADVEDWLDDVDRRTLVLGAMRQTEASPSLLGISGHLLTAATKPATA